MTRPTRADPGANRPLPGEQERKPSAPMEEEPFLIDPGSEDPGAGIDQLPPGAESDDQ